MVINLLTTGCDMSKIISTLNHFLTNITEHIEFIEEKSSDEANVVFKNENMI